MKRWFMGILVVAALTLMLAAACGQGNDGDSGTTETASSGTTETPRTIKDAELTLQQKANIVILETEVRKEAAGPDWAIKAITHASSAQRPLESRSAYSLEGRIIIADESTGSDGRGTCEGQADIVPGAEVIVRDEAGTIIGSGHLLAGLELPGLGCDLPFAVDELPRANFYSIEISGRPGPTYSFDDLKAFDFLEDPDSPESQEVFDYLETRDYLQANGGAFDSLTQAFNYLEAHDWGEVWLSFD
jgi:hypothetical protein